MPRTAAKTRPRAPEELTGEGLLAWDRLVTRLEKIGRLDDADPELMRIYCEQVETYSAARRAMAENPRSFEAPHNNGTAGRSVAYNVQKETAVLIQKLGRDLGLTLGGGGGRVDDDLEL